MKSYRVEEIEFDDVAATYTVDAATPFEAAARATSRTVTLRRGEADWIKVTQLTPSGDSRRPVEYEFHGIGGRSQRR